MNARALATVAFGILSIALFQGCRWNYTFSATAVCSEINPLQDDSPEKQYSNLHLSIATSAIGTSTVANGQLVRLGG